MINREMMEKQNQNFLVAMQNNSPMVLIDSMNGRIELVGRWISNNPEKLYNQMIAKLESMDWTTETITVTVQLEYFATKASRLLLDFLRRAADLQLSGTRNVTIKWYYEVGDDTLFEEAQDFNELVEVEFEIIGLSTVDYDNQLGKASALN